MPMRGTLRVLRAEARRLVATRATLGAALFLVLLSALRVLAAHVADASAHAARVQRAIAEGRELPEAVVGNAWAPFVDGWLTGLTAGTLLLLVASARAIAGDRERGILRLASTRSVSRSGLVLGRALLGPPLVLGAMAASALGAWLAARAFYEFGPLVEDGYELAGSGELAAELRAAALATFPPLCATWAFGLAVSSALRSATGALTATLVAYLGFDLFKEVLGEAQYLVFAAFNPSFVDRSCMKEMAGIARGFSDAGYRDDLYALNLWLPWPWALAALIAACWATARRPL